MYGRNGDRKGEIKGIQRAHPRRRRVIAVVSARQKTHFFREPVLPRLVISGLIINTGAIFSCRRIKNDNNFYLWRLRVIPVPAALAAGLVHASQEALFLRPRFRCSFSCSCCRSTAPRRWMLRAT
ncbi:MAG: hypothetical protein KZQ66_01880, partial [Candidatus Thiodiazotropha sp. (ex Lucinoma aequizonata)]|nr:hypothetical protein [Candidatus Thiodiazotropha sp. (ex Lucinoma aequizonata)]MCU7895411.1 hypothetical protein [Candidatus Thiodiazotropha sp. (ex Lucinoma aequizonata)]MCU7900914.1 hypothetical protein [Candidatus Thiodiazotropha sp. (ex Lucinoma aequizonata)]